MKNIFLIIIILLFISCKDVPAEPSGIDFFFESPQPVNDSELSKFPKRFQGTYINSDSTYLLIDETVILSEHDYGFNIHKKDLDSIKDTFEFINGKLIDKETNKIVRSRFFGDSLRVYNKWIDTLFQFSENNKIKRINGSLILNKKDSIYWKIKILSLEENILKFRYLYLDDDFRKMDSIIKIETIKLDSSSYLFKPTRKEFKSILKLKNLGDEQNFKKLVK